MKEYKTYKSSTIQTIELVANSLISFDIAKQNRENVIFSTELYKSRYRNPLTLTYHRNINNNDITAFGRGGYINVFYRLVKVDDTTLKVIYPNQEEEIFIYTDDKEKASKYAKILYAQSCLIAGKSIDNPTEYCDLVCELM